MEKYFKLSLGILISLFLISSILTGPISTNTRADIIDTFIDKNGLDADQIQLAFEYAGSNYDSANFELSVNSTIKSGSFLIKGSAYGGKYPTNVTVNVGCDEDYEWAFRGKGYGSLGHQYMLNNSARQKHIFISNLSYNRNAAIRLPKNAHVIATSMVLDGEGSGMILSGSQPATGTQYAGSFTDTYTYYDLPIKYIEFDCYSSDSTNYHIDVDGYKAGVGWEQIYYYHGYSNPGAKQYNYNPPEYTQWKMYYYDYDNNDNIKYDYEYHVGSACNNLKLDIGDNGIIDWSPPGEFKTIVTYSDFENELNSILSNPSTPSWVDAYGNEFVDIPLNFSADNIECGLLLKAIEIEYVYDAEVNIKPIGNLATELNENIIESFSDPAAIPIMISTDTAGKVNLHTVHLEFNIPPKLSDSIENQIVDEDTPYPLLLNLSNYFFDSDESSWLLNYTIKSNSEKTKLDVDINNHHYLRTTPIEENWVGETEVVVKAEDSYGKAMSSNKFKIIVNPINDEPYPNEERPIPDVAVSQGRIDKSIDLGNMGYFIDVENDELFYFCEVDPLDEYEGEQGNFSAYVNDDNVLCVIPLENWYGEGVPLWIYCDDDETIDTIDNNNGYYCYQEFKVDVNQVKSAPKWDFGGIPDIYRYEDSTKAELSDCLDLKKYVTDADTVDELLKFEIIEYTNEDIIVRINNNEHIDLEVPPNYYGTSIVTVRVTDKDGFYSDEIFEAHIVSVNDLPLITIDSHDEGEIVKETIELYGTSSDIEDTLNIVEIKIGYYNWQPTIGINNYTDWNYTWDTTMVDDDDYLIELRAFDGLDFSSAYINLTVSNGMNKIPEVEIQSPVSNSKVSGKIDIKGTATDPDGEVKSVEVKIGGTKWLTAQGTENWTYYWDTTTVIDDKYPIYVRAFDGEDYSAQRTITLNVDNGITELGDSEKESSFANLFFNIILVLIIIIVVVLVVVVLIVRSRRNAAQAAASKETAKDERVKAAAAPAAQPQPQPQSAPDFSMELSGYKVAKALPLDATQLNDEN